MTTLAKQLHSLLLINTGGMPKSQLADLLEVTTAELDNGIAELTTYLTDSGVVLLQTEEALQIAGQTEILPGNIQKELKSEQLSSAMLEVLTIIAYHQPITQLEIETMRGIGSEQTIKGLVERELVYAKNKNVDGISVPHYATSQAFLAHLGISSLTELPPLSTQKEQNATQ